MSCHSEDYQKVADPNHVSGGYPLDCLTCHSFSSWSPADFQHDLSDFPLTGAHTGLECSACHADDVYSGKSSSCYACHKQAYEATTEPNHQEAGFPTECGQCHRTTTWDGATFVHTDSRFPLLGAHKNLDCDACHGDGVYSGKSTECFSCHKKDFDATTDPNHVSAGFDVNCELCHDTSTWIGADFDHSGTDFPLTGAHIGVDCASCHADDVYAGKLTDCYSCHADDYQNTSNPNHVSAGFPQDCIECHDTKSWQGAEFDHDGMFFPIYSGKHKNKWDNDCASCHYVPNDYSIFSCIDCHKHTKTKTDKKHKDEPGYRYESSACYACHPNGKE